MEGVADRRRRAAVAGHTGDRSAARALLADPSEAVRATALGALERLGAVTGDDLAAALADRSPAVRRRACEVALGAPSADLRPLLDDPDPAVVEAAAWALGEREAAGSGAVGDLMRLATTSDDPLCREAAVAALGAIGDDRGLPAILSALDDRPNIRRRAVIALAPFSGPEVDEALRRAREDRDRQVRQAARELSDPDDRGSS